MLIFKWSEERRTAVDPNIPHTRVGRTLWNLSLLSRWNHIHHPFLCLLPSLLLAFRLMGGLAYQWTFTPSLRSHELDLSAEPVFGGKLTLPKPTVLQISVFWRGAFIRQCCLVLCSDCMKCQRLLLLRHEEFGSHFIPLKLLNSDYRTGVPFFTLFRLFPKVVRRVSHVYFSAT